LALSLFNSITKNIFCFFTPGLPPQSEAGGKVVNVFVIVLGVRLRILPAVCIEKRAGLPLSLGLWCLIGRSA
jgi:hypothetical protein